MRKNTVMRRNTAKRYGNYLAMVMAAAAVLLFTGCSREAGEAGQGGAETVLSESGREPGNGILPSGEGIQEENTEAEGEDGNGQTDRELEVRFGDRGEPFVLYLYDNPTAAAIARHVGTTEWRLPIYHYDDYDGWEYMQYYDMPSRYDDIPWDPEEVTDGKAGEVYYSEPGRIVLFYHDAQIQGEYTRVGYFDATEEFVSAVEDNPVLEGWGNKIVVIGDGR